jgi:hypothetical protein
MNDVLPAIFVVAIGTLLVVVVMQVGAGRRARATAARDEEYKAVADRAVAAQEAAERRLGEISSQLEGLNLRLGTVERILKDAE